MSIGSINFSDKIANIKSLRTPKRYQSLRRQKSNSCSRTKFYIPK